MQQQKGASSTMMVFGRVQPYGGNVRVRSRPAVRRQRPCSVASSRTAATSVKNT